MPLFAGAELGEMHGLGLGIQPPSADWGLAIADGYGFLTGSKWWVVVFNLIAQGIGAFETSDK